MSVSFVTPWTVAHKAPLSMGFSKQEYWRGLPFSSPGDLSDPVIKPASPALADGFFLPLSYQEAPKMSLKTESCSVMSDCLQPHGLYSPWISPGQNTGVGSPSLLQGIFPTLGSNPGLPHCRWILYQLSHQGIPRILEWVAYPFSRASSQPRNQTRLSCIAGGFFTT